VSKRILAAALWFASLSSAGGFAEVFFNVPAEIGGFLGIAAAVVVLLDPTGHPWGRRRRPTAHFASRARTA
jgi:hypothetical protein